MKLSFRRRDNENQQRHKKLLCIALILILAGSILASVFNGGRNVNVSRIQFDTESGTLSGLLYMPKDASASNPKPTGVVTHGYLNSAEMQDANAIELSRRGYVVLALDQYDYSHSDYKNELDARLPECPADDHHGRSQHHGRFQISPINVSQIPGYRLPFFCIRGFSVPRSINLAVESKQLRKAKDHYPIIF